MTLKFSKMHGLGNDFVMLDCLDGLPIEESKIGALSEAVCTQHFGVGGDGLILILPDEESDYRMRMWNPDGSESEMCGNGIRCFAKYLFDAGKIGEGKVSVATAKGLQSVEIEKGATPGANPLQVRVDMGEPQLKRSQIPMRSSHESTPGSSGSNGHASDGTVIDEVLAVEHEGKSKNFNITAVSMGNPHVVIFTDDVESVALKEIGFAIEHHDIFPSRTNVHFVQVIGPHKLWMRTWERGAGDTLACGSGACAVGVASALNHYLPENDRRALVHLPGGDLDIEWAANNHVYMTGPATTVFSGEFNDEFLKEATS